jgi:hypothetical protein
MAPLNAALHRRWLPHGEGATGGLQAKGACHRLSQNEVRNHSRPCQSSYHTSYHTILVITNPVRHLCLV